MHRIVVTVEFYRLLLAVDRDLAEVCRRLGTALVIGARRYPEGHGKIERFNRTALGALLRTLDGRPDVDPAPAALTLRSRCA